MTELDNIL